MLERWHYLDHAATTPLRPEALAAMVPALARRGRQPVRRPRARRVAARTTLDAAREELAEVVGCEPGELVFTSGGTEADNLAVRRRARRPRRHGGVQRDRAPRRARPRRPVGGRVVPVDGRGVVDLDALASVLDDDVALVSVMLVNNEIGTLQPLDAIAEMVHDRAPRAVLHTDAVAGALLGRRPSGRRGGRPRHARLAQVRRTGRHRGARGAPWRGHRAAAARWRPGARAPQRHAGRRRCRGVRGGRRRALRGRARSWTRAAAGATSSSTAVLAGVPGSVASAVPPGATRDHLVAGVVNVCLPAVDSEALLYVLEHEHAVLASAASSCASGAQEPSHVLAALGIERSLAAGSLRLSLGWCTTDADVTAAERAVPTAARGLQDHARDGAPA